MCMIYNSTACGNSPLMLTLIAAGYIHTVIIFSVSQPLSFVFIDCVSDVPYRSCFSHPLCISVLDVV